MHFISEDLEDYVANHSQKEPELLAQLNTVIFKAEF
jgi:caffeoyl-CoA O-methyltransferase